MEIETKLFFVFPITKEYEKLLKKTPDYIKKQFIDSKEDYLKTIVIEGKRYLGKQIEKPCSIESLDLLQTHLLSLLKRLVSNYSYDKESFLLIGLKNE